MGEQSSFTEIFQRLNGVESGLASHIASCTERREREEERQRNTDKKIDEVKEAMKSSQNDIQAIKSSVTEIKAKFAIIVSIVTTILTVGGNALMEYFKQ